MLVDAVAPGPSSGSYIVGNDGAGTILAARLDSSGSLSWAKDITVPTFTPVQCAAASSSNRLVIVSSSDVSTTAKTVVLMLDDTGSLVWESVLNSSTIVPTEGVLVGPDNSVYVIVLYDGPLGSSQYDAVLMKLNPTTGAITWQVGLSETSTTSFDDSMERFGSMCQLSGGDIVLTLWGPGSDTEDHGHIQRVSSTDGSVVWTRKVDFNSGAGSAGFYPSNLHIGIDGSDNIYAVGRAWDYGTGNADMPVVKLDSSGTLLWARHVRGSAGTPVFDECWGGLTADSSGVQIAGNMTSGKYGHLRVAAAGTIASAAVPLSSYTLAYTYTGNVVRCPQIGATTLWAFTDYTDGGSVNSAIFLMSSQAGAGDDGSYGGGTWASTRATVNYDLVAGSATISTPSSWTRPSTPTLTLAADLGASVGTGTLSPVTVLQATSVGPSTQFGLAYLQGYTTSVAPSVAFGLPLISRSFINVGITPPSTTFGAAASRQYNTVTSFGPTANFGTPAYTANSTREASPVEPTTNFGTPFGTLGSPDAPTHTASSVPPSTVFGTPAAAYGFTGAATGTQFGSFGTAAARLGQAALGATPSTTFGTATVTMSRAATPINSTAFGTPRSGVGCVASGFSGTMFGGPELDLGSSFPASGWSSTAFGTPTCSGVTTRTRSAYFRTRFGLPQAERTAP